MANANTGGLKPLWVTPEQERSLQQLLGELGGGLQPHGSGGIEARLCGGRLSIVNRARKARRTPGGAVSSRSGILSALGATSSSDSLVGTNLTGTGTQTFATTASNIALQNGEALRLRAGGFIYGVKGQGHLLQFNLYKNDTSSFFTTIRSGGHFWLGLNSDSPPTVVGWNVQIDMSAYAISDSASGLNLLSVFSMTPGQFELNTSFNGNLINVGATITGVDYIVGLSEVKQANFVVAPLTSLNAFILRPNLGMVSTNSGTITLQYLAAERVGAAS